LIRNISGDPDSLLIVFVGMEKVSPTPRLERIVGGPIGLKDSIDVGSGETVDASDCVLFAT
jgi:hypothetical protein